MKRLELFIEGVILASRWLLVIFYLGLALALALYAATFGYKLWDFASHLFSLEESDSILKMLSLIDAGEGGAPIPQPVPLFPRLELPEEEEATA